MTFHDKWPCVCWGRALAAVRAASAEQGVLRNLTFFLQSETTRLRKMLPIHDITYAAFCYSESSNA